MNNFLIEKYIPFVEGLCKKYDYDNNIRHLLILIVPAFVHKYKYKSQLIEDVFNSIPIIINNKSEKYVNAYYTSVPVFKNNIIKTNKYIVINNYGKISLIKLLDNLIHEFNHAINSYNKEINTSNNILYLRTGLTYTTYFLPSLKPKAKMPTYILEEIINTKQTELIIDNIKNLKCGVNEEINNTIYNINKETKKNYESMAYALETNILKELLSNNTFIYTLENLRIEGNIEDIEGWFDNITNMKNSYNTLNNKLYKIMTIEENYESTRFLKKRKIEQIKSLIKDINYIIKIFNENTHHNI